jgi:hypothetical protein
VASRTSEAHFREVCGADAARRRRLIRNRLRLKVFRCGAKTASSQMINNVLHLPTCHVCKCPMRLLSIVGDQEDGPVTRVLQCVRCRATMVRPAGQEKNPATCGVAVVCTRKSHRDVQVCQMRSATSTGRSSKICIV